MLSVLSYHVRRNKTLSAFCWFMYKCFRNHVPFSMRGSLSFQIAKASRDTLVVLNVLGPINLSITLNLRTHCQKKKKNYVTIVISCLDIADFF